MFKSNISKAIVYSEYGNPDEVLSLNEIHLEKLGPEDIAIRILAAPINPADIGRINGTYGTLAPIPAVAGLEGVAVIENVGKEVEGWNPGEKVFVPAHIGSWQTKAVVKQDTLYRAPENLPIETAAMGWINPPTAWKMLHDFVHLEEGDWIIQNAATSSVGKLVIEFARHLNIRTANLARNPEAIEPLKELGADEVFLDNDHAASQLRKAMGDSKAKLGLNAVGGRSAYRIAKCLEDGGSLVTYGGVVREAAPFPTRYLIFNDLRIRGFWVSRFYRSEGRQEIEKCHSEIFKFMEAKAIDIDVAKTYPLDCFKEALSHAFEPGKKGKILFSMRESG